MLGAYEVVDTEYLPLEQAPGALQAVRVDEIVLHVLADGVVDGMTVEEQAVQSAVAAVFVGQDV